MFKQANLLAFSIMLFNAPEYLNAIPFFSKPSSEISTTTLTTPDKVDLAVTCLKRSPAKSTILICHGLGDSRRLIHHFEKLFPHDTLVAHDFRGHGESTGKTSLGVHEYKDVSTVLQHIHATNTEKLPVFGIGISMGGASLMKAVANGEQVNGMVIDSAYASLYDVTQNQANKYRLVSWLPSSVKNSVIKRFVCNGGDTKSVTIEDYGHKINAPVLIFHDTADALIPYEHGKRIKQALPNSELITTHNIRHACICTRYPQLYTHNATNFFNRIR